MTPSVRYGDAPWYGALALLLLGGSVRSWRHRGAKSSP